MSGLFQQAILQSGTESAPWAVNIPKTQPEDYLRQVAQSFNCSVNTSVEIVECLQAVDATELSEAEFRCTVSNPDRTGV